MGRLQRGCVSDVTGGDNSANAFGSDYRTRICGFIPRTYPQRYTQAFPQGYPLAIKPAYQAIGIAHETA
jgi:hypothetical protein